MREPMNKNRTHQPVLHHSGLQKAPNQRSCASKLGFANLHAGHEGSAWNREPRSSLHTCGDGEAILASARHPRCSPVLISGSGTDYGLRCGSSGSVGTSGLRHFANGASDLTWLLKRRVVLMARGDSRTDPPFITRSKIPTSTRSASSV